LICNSWFRS